ncbi:hypothetical protein FZC78_11385 [Rossellomorea vietnamensis]|uniref:Uncharacterized protein n=1 Tax=Rossellomorea vietnamensis TaxID=218284 RepID=A0A5D4NRT1_9BACI|nr:hypothetical protein [Rossellomorea vietnamensis]TYS16589.1 hypothetical protein FZC78_11385 [Rossellomorea vietnamensis]
MKGTVNGLKDSVRSLEGSVDKVQETVDRIEASQTQDVVALLKTSRKYTESEFDYLNSRLTHMDNHIFKLEKRVEN